MIPQAAVLTDQGGAYVLVVDGENKVDARPIATGQRFGPDLVATAGLAAGEWIILYSIQKVRPGAQVKPELSAAPTDPAAPALFTPVPERQGGDAAAPKESAAAQAAGDAGGDTAVVPAESASAAADTGEDAGGSTGSIGSSAR